MRDKLGLGLFISIGILALAGVVTAIVLLCMKGPEDNGLMIRSGQNGNDVTLKQSICRPKVIASTSIDEKVLEEAVDWWNKADQPYRISSVRGEKTFDAYFSKGLYADDPMIIMSTGETTNGVGDLTDITFNKMTGRMQACFVVVNTQYTYHRDTYLGVVKHSIGHCLGLEDDPNPGIDLNSNMRLELNVKGRLTEGDSETLARTYKEVGCLN
jgi:hypothetical protein